NIAVGGDGHRARAVVVRENAVAAADRRAGGGGHAEIGAEDVVHGVDAGNGAGDIAVGGDGRCGRAQVARRNAPGRAADRGAGGGGRGEVGAGAGIVCVDAATTGAGGITVGGDGERAGAEVARRNAPGGAADRGAGGGGHGEIGAGVVQRVDAVTV